MFFLNSTKKEKITKIIKKTLSLPYISFEMMGEFAEINFCANEKCLEENKKLEKTKIILLSFEKRNFLDKGLVIGKDVKTASQIIGMILVMETDETFEKFETPNAFFLNDGKESELLKVLEEKRKILSKEYFDSYLNNNKEEKK
jgi:hypothetical protein